MTTQTTQSRKRITREQQTQLVEAVIHLLSLGKHPSEIKRAINREYDLSRRSVERYITRARREMTDRVEAPVHQQRAESFFFYVSVVNDPKSHQRERLRARERIDKLLGLDLPVHLRNDELEFNLTPKDIQNMTDEELSENYDRLMNQPGAAAKVSYARANHK
ncbi:MAG: hypothetical protein ABIK07_21260 [Planctomycetota bacterium]